MDRLYFWSQVFGAACIIVALIAGRFVNKAQSTEILELRTRAANAEKSLLQFQRLIYEPRTIDRNRAHEILSAAHLEVPPGSIFVVHSDTAETRTLAEELRKIFVAEGLPEFQLVGEGSIRPGITILFNNDDWVAPKTDPNTLPDPVKTMYRLISESIRDNPSTHLDGRHNFTKTEVDIRIGPKY